MHECTRHEDHPQLIYVGRRRSNRAALPAALSRSSRSRYLSRLHQGRRSLPGGPLRTAPNTYKYFGRADGAWQVTKNEDLDKPRRRRMGLAEAEILAFDTLNQRHLQTLLSKLLQTDIGLRLDSYDAQVEHVERQLRPNPVV